MGICFCAPARTERCAREPMPNADYAKRLVSCNAQINYYLEARSDADPS
jgi:hypothetical protein